MPLKCYAGQVLEKMTIVDGDGGGGIQQEQAVDRIVG